METIEELERRSEEIKEKLKPWRGLTITEAKKRGWGPEQDALQAELWDIGYRITRAKAERRIRPMRGGYDMPEEKEGLKMRNILLIGGLALAALLIFSVMKARAEVPKIQVAIPPPAPPKKKKKVIELPPITIPWPFPPKAPEAKPVHILPAPMAGLRLVEL